MKIYIFTIALLMFTATTYSQSNPPTPRPIVSSEIQKPEATPKKELSNGYQHGTDNFPIVVKISNLREDINPPISKNTTPTEDKSSYDWGTIMLVIFNGILAISTIALWWSTRNMWKATNKTADLTYKTFIATNRPRLRIRRVHSDPSILPVWVYISNIGGSNAIAVELHAVFASKTNNSRTAPWIENLSKSIWHGPTILMPGQEGYYELRSKIDLGPEDLENISFGGITLLIIGKIRYQDFNQTWRETGFGWVYDTETGEFSKPNDEDQYNYED
jgi:hypothetical protein